MKSTDTPADSLFLFCLIAVFFSFADLSIAQNSFVSDELAPAVTTNEKIGNGYYTGYAWRSQAKSGKSYPNHVLMRTVDSTEVRDTLTRPPVKRRRPFDRIQFEIMPFGGGFYSVDKEIWGVSGGITVTAIFNSFLGAAAEFQIYRFRREMPQSRLQRENADFSYSLMFHHSDDIYRVFCLLGFGQCSGNELWEQLNSVSSPAKYRSTFAVPSLHFTVGLNIHVFHKFHFSVWLKKQIASEFSLGGSSHSFNTFFLLSGLQYRF